MSVPESRDLPVLLICRLPNSLMDTEVLNPQEVWRAEEIQSTWMRWRIQGDGNTRETKLTFLMPALEPLSEM